MSTSFKGYVATPQKDVRILWLLGQAIQHQMRYEAEANENPLQAYRNRSVQCRMSLDSDLATYNFTVAGRQRALTAHLDCDADLREIAPAGLVVSMGADDVGRRIVSRALDYLRLLGPTFTEDDLDDGPIVPLDRDVTIGDLVADGGLNLFDVKKLADMQECGLFDPHRSFEDAFGMDRNHVEGWLERHRATFGLRDNSSRSVDEAFTAECLVRIDVPRHSHQTSVPMIP